MTCDACLVTCDLCPQAEPVKSEYPTSVMAIAVLLTLAGTAPILIVFLMRRFQCVKVDMDIHQAAIKRIDTTVSTTGMVREAEVRARVDPDLRVCFDTRCAVSGAGAGGVPCRCAPLS